MMAFDRVLYLLLAALIVMLPFEFPSFSILSNLQWMFIGIAVISLPVVIRERKMLAQQRLVRAAIVFVATQWAAAALAPEFAPNAAKAALRITAGFILLCATLSLREKRRSLRVWAIAAFGAAVYALVDYSGFGLTRLFHGEDFYIGSVARLSGSFEYPNTAAAYFALSLPVVWSDLKSRWLRVAGLLIVASALIMTYSRAAEVSTLVGLAIWAVGSKRKSELQVAIFFAVLFIAVLFLNRDVHQRFSPEFPKDFSAQYEPEFNLIRDRPDTSGSLRIHIRNTGTTTWTARANAPFSLSYRLYDVEKKTLVQKEVEAAVIPTPLRAQESVDVRASFRIPKNPGFYLMTLDIFNKESGWFSGRGVYPGLVEVHVGPDQEPRSGQTDTSRWIQRDISNLYVANVPYSRTELWKAAADMSMKHPVFGVGPDNFRLLYGRQYGATRWNTKIRANSLYLDLLSGSGLVGLAAFCVMMASVPWKPNAPCISLAIFLIHGVLDTFLMTTPIYFAFWILLGQSEDSTG